MLNYFLGIEFTIMSNGDFLKTKYIFKNWCNVQRWTILSLYQVMISQLALSTHIGDLFDNPKVCQLIAKPLTPHWLIVKRILRYLQWTTSFGIVFKPSTQLQFRAVVNTDSGVCLDDNIGKIKTYLITYIFKVKIISTTYG